MPSVGEHRYECEVWDEKKIFLTGVLSAECSTTKQNHDGLLKGVDSYLQLILYSPICNFWNFIGCPCLKATLDTCQIQEHQLCLARKVNFSASDINNDNDINIDKEDDYDDDDDDDDDINSDKDDDDDDDFSTSTCDLFANNLDQQIHQLEKTIIKSENSCHCWRDSNQQFVNIG